VISAGQEGKMKLVTVEQMRRIEKQADAAGHTYAAMMERAGAAVAHAIQAPAPAKAKRVLILVGPGNNGGDGLVAARVLREAGDEVSCYLLSERPGDPLLQAARDVGVTVAVAAQDATFNTLNRLAREANVIVDALLGTGAARPIEGLLAGLLQTVKHGIEQRNKPKVKELRECLPASTQPHTPEPLLVGVDGPTGLNYDTGALEPAAIPMDLTITFAYPKPGHFAFPGASACGRLLVADIGTDPHLADDIQLEVADAEMVRALLPPRPADAHKGTFGKALLVAGSIYYSGAAALAAQAAARVGTGLVTLALPRAIYGAVASKLTEITYHPLPDSLGVLNADAVRVLGEKLKGYQALLVGPGLSTEKETITFVRRLLNAEPPTTKGHIGFQSANDKAGADQIALPPLVVDADALNALAEVEDWAKRLPPLSILTPHPGEMARLMKLEDKTALQDRLGMARKMAAEWGHVLILKGAFTVVAHPDGRAVVLPFANPALATAGSGDVLAGAVVGLLAQGLSPFDAAVCGGYLHGLAGELARREMGEAGVIAGDLLARLPEAMRTTRQL
jgi:NAD(P)H-hydrate epimerase